MTTLAATMTVLDPKGIVVGFWNKEVRTLDRGTTIVRGPMGACLVDGKLLNLPMDIQNKLIAKQRVAIVA